MNLNSCQIIAALNLRPPIGVGMRDLTSPLPPNRTGGSPASGSPVSGFVVVRLYVSMHVPPPRTAAHAGQTIRSASGDGPSPALSRHHPTAIAADCATVVSPVSYTHLRAHETRHDLVCRLLLEKKKKDKNNIKHII